MIRARIQVFVYYLPIHADKMIKLWMENIYYAIISPKKCTKYIHMNKK